MLNSMNDEGHIYEAMTEARSAMAEGESRWGAIVVSSTGEISAEARTALSVTMTRRLSIAEIVAMRQAARHLNNYRLSGCSLYVTLEPCSMCAGAILHASYDRLVYAASDPKAGACGSVLEVMKTPHSSADTDPYLGGGVELDGS